MRLDAYGLPLTSDSDEAAEAFDRGVTGLLSWDRHTVDFFRDSATRDPALAGGRDWETAERHLDVLRARGRASGNDIWERVVIPLNEAQHAFIRGEWDRVIEKTEPIRSQIIRLGGSTTQRDAFHDTLLEAALRSTDTERARRYLGERLSRRAEHFWTGRQPDA